MSKKIEVPIWHKTNLTIEEAAKYTSIGIAKLYEMTSKEDCPYVIWIGTRRMIKRRLFEEYIMKVNSI